MYYFVPYPYTPITIEVTQSVLQQTLDGIFRIIYTWKVFAEPSTEFSPISLCDSPIDYYYSIAFSEARSKHGTSAHKSMANITRENQAFL